MHRVILQGAANYSTYGVQSYYLEYTSDMRSWKNYTNSSQRVVSKVKIGHLYSSSNSSSLNPDHQKGIRKSHTKMGLRTGLFYYTK